MTDIFKNMVNNYGVHVTIIYYIKIYMCTCICTLGYHKYITYGLREKQRIYVPQWQESPEAKDRWLHTGQGFSVTEGLIFSYICPKRHILYTIWHFKIKMKVTIIIIEHWLLVNTNKSVIFSCHFLILVW